MTLLSPLTSCSFGSTDFVVGAGIVVLAAAVVGILVEVEGVVMVGMVVL
jgi:hypothetical protein